VFYINCIREAVIIIVYILTSFLFNIYLPCYKSYIKLACYKHRVRTANVLYSQYRRSSPLRRLSSAPLAAAPAPSPPRRPLAAVSALSPPPAPRPRSRPRCGSSAGPRGQLPLWWFLSPRKGGHKKVSRGREVCGMHTNDG
jgi:hypothetical protein